MTDKQIIIDNIDVSGCDDYKCDGTCASSAYHLFNYDIKYAPCQNRNCYYKKLKRKEQEYSELITENENLSEENEVLKEINSRLQYMLDDVIEKVLKDDDQTEYFYTELKEKFTTKLDEIIKENDKFKQTITKIRDIAENRQIFCENCTGGVEEFTCNDCGYIKILQKISEVVDE